MSFSNLEYLYQNLPARYRREDNDLFLKRFLQFFGDTLDGWDDKYGTFFENINPDTAPADWIEFWLEALFGWSWFPWWFTITEKRRLYGNFAQHLARRGTRRGIELWLLDFGIVAKVHTRALPYGEFVWGESSFVITQPLRLVIEVLFLQSSSQDLHAIGEGAWGEAYYVEPKPLLTEREILDLIRFAQPHAQEIVVTYRVTPLEQSSTIYWEQIQF